MSATLQDRIGFERDALRAEVARLQAIVDEAKRATDPSLPVSVKHDHWVTLNEMLWPQAARANP